jgi:hypothetical protein
LSYFYFGKKELSLALRSLKAVENFGDSRENPGLWKTPVVADGGFCFCSALPLIHDVCLKDDQILAWRYKVPLE